MNVHHLELFYHVAKNGGITEAARRMPYGIQQPAISAQILRLEQDLGVTLFQRRPFLLTPAGHELFDFVEPFFGKVDETRARLRGEVRQRLRLAAPGAILRDYLPRLLEEFRRSVPQLRLNLHAANQAAAESMLRKNQIDLAITELEGPAPPGLRCCPLLKLPLYLLVPYTGGPRSAAEVWTKGNPTRPLICLPSDEAITKLFRRGLRSMSLDWPTSVEVSALDLIPVYVRAGFGIGLAVAVPGEKAPPQIRSLPLTGFPRLVIAALWQGKLPDVTESFLGRVKSRARELQKERT